MSSVSGISGASPQSDYIRAMNRMLRPGDKVQLLYLEGRPPLPKNAVGIVERVEPNGSISIMYENSSLRAVPGRDVIRRITNIALIKESAVKNMQVAQTPETNVKTNNWQEYSGAVYIGEVKNKDEAAKISGISPENIDIIEV